MKLNNKGFAISSILYIILILAIVLIALLLTLFNSKRLIVDKVRKEALDNIYGVICKPVTSKTKTVGNIPSGTFNKGDEYICEVKANTSYHFFVLSTKGDKVSLIMDSNINNSGIALNNPDIAYEDYGEVTWYSERVNSHGPVTVMNKLHDITSTWDNISNIVIDYKDEGPRYGGIKTTNNVTNIIRLDDTVSATITNLKARLPMESELLDAGCTYENGSCPKWLVNYLYKSVHVPGAINVSVYGYWTLASSRTYETVAIDIGAFGKLYDIHTVDANSYGIRPVIEVDKSSFSQ